MPLDYSKWDALELSDDSDIEVHPNVDKKSFIRAKQAQIHQQRAERRLKIQTMKHERKLNEGMLSRTDGLIQALRRGKADGETSPEKTGFNYITSLLQDPENDKPPKAPEGIYKEGQNPPSYAGLMMTLFGQVKTEVDKAKDADQWEAYIAEVTTHADKIKNLQSELETELAKLEAEEKSHITSDDIHTGFDVSHVSKSTDSNPKVPQKQTQVELLNPGSVSQAKMEKDTDVDGDLEEATELGKKFLKIAEDDLITSRQFLVDNPQMTSQRETDALLVEAFNSQMEGKDKYARRCVHHALLAQYCRQLGPNGVPLFFSRIMDKNHRARGLFYPDVDSTYKRIRERSAAIKAERAKEPAQTEQIQLHPVSPDTTINIVVPPEDDVEARKIFESFNPELRAAVESGKLDEINRVLGEMSVEEAEAVIAKLGEGNMLSIEEQVIDATTEEGKEMLKQLEERAAEERKLEELSANPPEN